MSRLKKPSDFLSIDDIRALFAKHLNIKIQRVSVYHYIKNMGFPQSTGWGRPRQWDKALVLKWFETQTK